MLMQRTYGIRKAPPQARRLLTTVSVLAVATSLAGCSYVPDWANPVSWYDSVFADSGAASLPGLAPATVAEADAQGFQDLAEVPREPPATSPAGATVSSLIADRDSARYTNEILLQGGGAAAAASAASVIARPAAPAPTTAQQAVPQVADAAPGLAPAPAHVPAALAQAAPVQSPAPVPVSPAPTVAPPDLAGLSIPELAQPGLPVFQGGPQVSPLLSGGPTPIPPSRGTMTLGEPVAASLVAAAPQAVPPAPLAVRSAPMATAVVDAVQPAPVSPAQVAQVLPQAQALGAETLAQTFAQMLQESAATVTTMTPLSQSAPNATPVTPESFADLFAATFAPTVVRFGHDSALLDSAARSALREMADRYKADGGHIRVVGHASSRTGDMDLAQHNRVNFDVSVDRAHAVASELMRLGVAPSALTVEAVGDAEAAFVEAMPSGEAANRRVEIYFPGA